MRPWRSAITITARRIIDADALAQLKEFREKYPDSVMTEPALQAMGTATLALNQPADALVALDAYALTSQRPALLFLRGEAHEQSAQLVEAAKDYQAIYLQYPTSTQAREAGEKLNFLRSGKASDQIPPIPLDQQLIHAGIVFSARIFAYGVATFRRRERACCVARAGMRIASGERSNRDNKFADCRCGCGRGKIFCVGAMVSLATPRHRNGCSD
ncbi:MAG: hypothetical protein ABSB65_17205 [Candidatus Acidiferrales bacterium]